MKFNTGVAAPYQLSPVLFYFQLKKVRLRTTFASQDTSGAGVKLSCCEHYENVLFSYTDQEITAVNEINKLHSI